MAPPARRAQALMSRGHCSPRSEDHGGRAAERVGDDVGGCGAPATCFKEGVKQDDRGGLMGMKMGNAADGGGNGACNGIAGAAVYNDFATDAFFWLSKVNQLVADFNS